MSKALNVLMPVYRFICGEIVTSFYHNLGFNHWNKHVYVRVYYTWRVLLWTLLAAFAINSAGWRAMQQKHHRHTYLHKRTTGRPSLCG